MFQTVFLIDDDHVIQYLNRHIMQSVFFCKNIIEAYNGLDALEYYKKLEHSKNISIDMPEIIFLDLNMPLMDGWEFYEIFKKKYPEYLEKTKIIFLTSSINPEEKKRALKNKNIVAFISKPLTEKILIDVINMLNI
ncbi:MAG: response regulator [Flavobacterium sp.]